MLFRRAVALLTNPPVTPESPFGRTGFIIRRARIRTCPVTLRRGRLAIPSCGCTPYESACNSRKPVRKNGLYHSPCVDSDLSGYAAAGALLFRRAVALLTNPPVTPESPFRRTGFIIRSVRIRTCPVTLRCGAPCYSVVRLHSLRIRRIFDFLLKNGFPFVGNSEFLRGASCCRAINCTSFRFLCCHRVR